MIGSDGRLPRYNTPKQKARLGCEVMLLVLSMVYLAKVDKTHLENSFRISCRPPMNGTTWGPSCS